MNVLMLYWRPILDGLLVTLELSVLSIIGALIIGLIVGTCRLSPISSLQSMGRAYIEIVRSLPITVILVFIFFAGPSIEIFLTPFQAATAGLSLYMASYVAEALRSGVNSIAEGEIDAARALGFGYKNILFLVLIPQSVRIMIPTFGNIIVDLTKHTSVAYTIAVIELTGAATNMAAQTAEPYIYFIIAIALYLLITLSIGYSFRLLEKITAFVR